GVHGVQLRLDVQRANQRVRIEQKQLEQRVKQLSEEPDDAAVRLEQRVRLEAVVRQDRRLVGRHRLSELIQQIGSHAARIEKLLELHRRQLADLFLGVVDAALLADARADLLHDVLDIHRVGANVEFGHKQLSA